MSGASAVASARRRRAQPEPPQPQQTQQRQQQQSQQQESNDQKLTPLQILHVHDGKIKELEDKMEERIMKIVNEKFSQNSNNNSQTQLQSNEQITEMINKNVEQSFSSKMNNVNDTIKSILLNMEKFSSFNKINEVNTQKIDELIKEMNSLKMLVIKSQTLSLETNGEIVKMKDQVRNLETKVETVESSLSSQEQDREYLGMDANPTEMLLKTMMQQQFGGQPFTRLNIHDDVETDNSDENNMDAHSNINISEEIEDIKITDDILSEIKTEVAEEIVEITETKLNSEENSTIEEIHT